MFTSALVTLREGMEAALIIGILLGFATKTKQIQLKKYIFWGFTLGIAFSILTAFVFTFVADGFKGKNEEIFEGLIMIVAAGIITYMLTWMQKQSRSIKQHIEKIFHDAVSKQKLWSIVSLSFLAVYREGVEIVLFLGAIMTKESTAASLTGALIGLTGAVILSFILFKSTVQLSLPTFFKITSYLLLFIAAGLVAHGIHELQEALFLPVFIEHLYDINGIINEKATFGSLLKAMFGYNGNPSLIEVIAYWIYLITIGWILLFKNNANKMEKELQ